jgi:L-gulonolactone oxidase
MGSIKTDAIQLKDWSGYTVLGESARVYVPTSEQDVARVVSYCVETKQRLRVVGRQTSWNTLWYCHDVMMTTKELNSIREIDEKNLTITCHPGVLLKDIHRELWEKGLTLDTAPAIDWITVGGAISTGSHGSGPASISSSLIRCRLVTGNGEIIQIDEKDEHLDAVRISLGLLGVLTSVTLKVVRAFDVSAKGMRIATTKWRRFLDEGEMSYLLCFPYTESSVFVRADKLARSPEYCVSGQPTLPTEIEADMKNVKCEVGKLAQRLPTTFPARNRYLLDVFFRDFETSGPAHQVLMSYTSDPIAGGEWAIPIAAFEDAFKELLHEADGANFYLPTIWLKKVEKETAWLGADDRCVQCGIYHDVFSGIRSPIEETLKRIEPIFLKHGGRPHLGKLICTRPFDIARAFPSWDRFNALRRELDPQGTFVSDAITSLFGNSLE